MRLWGELAVVCRLTNRLFFTYERPWGEPWWKFRDTWLEVDGTVYVLSYHAPPNSFESYSETYNQSLESFHFAD